MEVGSEKTLETLRHQRHRIADLQGLDEQQQRLKHFMDNWFAQQDQILQAICNAVQMQNEATSQAVHMETVLTPGPATTDEDQIEHQQTDLLYISDQSQTATSFQRSDTSGSDMLGPVRNSTEVLHHAVEAYKSSASTKLGSKVRKSTALVNQGLAPFAKKTEVSPTMVKLVSSPWFEYLCQACIIVNAVVIACAADYAAKNLENPKDPILEGIEIGFSAFYI